MNSYHLMILGYLFYTHEGEATTFTITLGWTGNMARPTVFTAEPISIGPGETAAFHPTNWRSLNNSPVELILMGHNGIVSQKLLNSVRETLLFTIDNMSVLDTSGTEKSLKIDTTWTASDDLNNVKVIVWLVTKDDTLIGQNVITLNDINQNIVGSRTDSWMFLPPEPGDYNFTAYILEITDELPPNSHILYKTVSFTVDNTNQQGIQR